ncbi:acetyl/propionyl/methylcrotonyl-CoA carboxylase subunit alpha [Saccharopolyspora mangrovi]|uniref:Biotin carboxylase N-terminal domain-containing protein n=1 Tax=Saccharopolyspora mangrovi TaxID=3082379 RepID=A0ABU6A7K8_9PSEU|nr:biotin carboxylase N-terminal domain-containing protein [Saccharopolyspora sp. S2-29]MEB3367443.1 biotin carboxylase N-terminal domain-containing protein [Saccharopolyspora sp. S2-29]
MITNVLVANRGEIARRVFATARRMGLSTTAVFSDTDAAAPHAAEAYVAIRLPGDTPGETYLQIDQLVQAARSAGADAVHPGYGFLSENAAFAQAVSDAGLRWVGPPVKAIESMGSKVEAKALMADAGVPVLSELDPQTVTESDLPVLVKASAGGGGRGMRVVRSLAELPEQLEAARREAESAFGDPTVFCERYLETGRHIEVQVLADQHGTVWALGERECSIQRRHQKVVEEAPSPLVERTPGMRERLFEAARLAASAIGYEGAGTVEFLADEKGEFFFLEMNTRLQVEHPVTENTTGTDLVRLQLQIADGHALPAEPPAAHGHSIEVRLYAEDPAHDWRPQSGTLRRIEFPDTAAQFAVLRTPGIRLDSGFADGDAVSIHYDPMLAKVIACGETRDEAARVLAASLSRAKIHGLVTNRDLLVRVLRHPAFLAGDTDTAFFDRHGLADLARPLATDDTADLAAVAAAMASAAENRLTAAVNARIPSGWRNLPSVPQTKTYTCGDREIEVSYLAKRTGVEVADHPGLALVEATPTRVVLDVPGEHGPVRRTFDVARYGEHVHVDSPLGPVALVRQPRFTDPAERLTEGSLLAPMPGKVIRLAAAPGDQVTSGQPILWLEAMKMEHTVAAPADGVLTELNVIAGQQVEVGTVLAVVDTPAEEKA